MLTIRLPFFISSTYALFLANRRGYCSELLLIKKVAEIGSFKTIAVLNALKN